MSPSPQSQAIDGRNEVIQDVLNSNLTENKMLASEYAEAVRQWVANKQQVVAGTVLPPIPVPSKSWIYVPHVYTPAESLYDASYPGIAPLIDDVQTGPPVAGQYVEPAAPSAPTPGTVVHVGPYERNGEFGCMPDDNMPAGYVTRAPDGTWVKKVLLPTPFGTTAMYTANV